ncbi:unnamed protein product [Hyaloperonospora brassicae]|uniref:C2H2-type domain-containing protein n=1 Tax=Hyaloperonospora brassicae TaxID=162125 RepID=A0AAV0U2U1_HYABA|nr:unnamed protein product [Hyaloperonospora brassicae]CAI5738544.1 unnamed protein product [Hyaloperonospora brassicae]
MHASVPPPLNNNSSSSSFASHGPLRPRRAPPSEHRPFTCPVPTSAPVPVAHCHKRFSTSGNLARHRKLHAVQRLVCPTPACSREFRDRETLTRHLGVHLSGTAYTCGLAGCHKTFSTSGNLTRHCRTRHQKGPSGPDDSGRRQPLRKNVTPAENLRPERLLPLNGPPSWIARGPVVPGALLVTAPVAVGHQCSRFSDQDVRDLLDCLFVTNVDAAVTTAPVASIHGIIRSEPLLRSAYHQP